MGLITLCHMNKRVGPPASGLQQTQYKVHSVVGLPADVLIMHASNYNDPARANGQLLPVNCCPDDTASPEGCYPVAYCCGDSVRSVCNTALQHCITSVFQQANYAVDVYQTASCILG